MEHHFCGESLAILSAMHRNGDHVLGQQGMQFEEQKCSFVLVN